MFSNFVYNIVILIFAYPVSLVKQYDIIFEIFDFAFFFYSFYRETVFVLVYTEMPVTGDTAMKHTYFFVSCQIFCNVIQKQCFSRARRAFYGKKTGFVLSFIFYPANYFAFYIYLRVRQKIFSRQEFFGSVQRRYEELRRFEQFRQIFDAGLV